MAENPLISKAEEKSRWRGSQSSAVLGCVRAQEEQQNQPRRYGQPREKNSPEREVANSPNNCHDKRKRVSARLNLAYPGWTINGQGLLTWKAAQRKPEGEGSTEKKCKELKPSGCKQIWQDCKAFDVGLGMGRML